MISKERIIYIEKYAEGSYTLRHVSELLKERKQLITTLKGRVEMEIKVDPEDINRYMSQKLIESSIGEAVKKEIDKQVDLLTSSYKSPIEPIVSNYINKTIQDLVEKKFKKKIEQQVRDFVTVEFVEKLINKLWDTFRNRY